MRRMLAVLVVLAGCASAPEPTVTETSVRRAVTRIESDRGTAYVVEQTVEEHVRSSTVRAAPKLAWRVLPLVYEQLGVPVTVLDPRSRTLGTRDVRVRRLGRERPSRYLECGAGLGGEFADHYDVYLTVTTRVAASGSDTELHSRVAAVARDPNHGNSALRCTSKGSLEQAIADGVRARVGG